MHKTADGTHPSGIEQQMLWLMNRARSNPPAEGNFLAATGDPSAAFAITFFGVDVPRMKSEFAVIEPSGPAAFDRRLYEASRQHSEYMISIDTQTHDGQFERVDSAGFEYSAIRLNVFAYCETPVHGHATLNIDVGGPPSEGGMQAGRGHRLAIMSSDPDLPELTSAGLALVAEINPSTEVGPLVFSGAYASALEGSAESFNRFIVGTVWNDLNADGLYEDGEGVNGVRVQPDHGAWHAITGSAGGYAIPVTTPGSYQLTFSGGGFPGSFSRGVTVADISVPEDVEISSLPATPAPLTATLRINPAGGMTLTWSGGYPPYQVQRTGNPAGKWQNVGSLTQELSMTVNPDGAAGFFRIVGSP